jgi:cytochrome c oxidase subunit 2
MRRVWIAATAGGVLVLALAGCGGGQSALNPSSPAARDIATLWWWMLLAAGIVFGGAVALLAIAFLRRNREGLPVLQDSEGIYRGIVVLFGFAIPVVVLIAVFTVANFAVAAKTNPAPPGEEQLTVQVTGRQWWWEISYPGTRNAVTANELHIPVRTHVGIEVRTADVIHSFWVPELNRKIDLIPGKRNRVDFYAEKPGRYEGQCAEYCGLQHAHMRLIVIAQPASQFQAFLRHAASPATPPTSAVAKAGEQLFLSNACASCHQIRGTPAVGQVGPDLTHVMERSTLAALTIPNTPGYLRAWIQDPQHFKPGNQMPGLHLAGSDFNAIATYLEGLR